MVWVTKFYGKYQTIVWIIAATITITAVIICFLISNCCRSEIINGFSFLISALIAATLAIHKYQSEQRTSRLQKVYFEDTLYGQAKVLEITMSRVIKNYQKIMSLFNLSENIISQENILVKNKIKDLEIIFDNTIKTIDACIDTALFKKETIYKLLSDAEQPCALFDWISKFEDDAGEFSCFLQGQVTILRSHLYRLEENNLGNFDKALKEISTHIKRNYPFIDRHHILFSLFSVLVLEFVAVHYTSKTKILNAFMEVEINKVINLINEYYNDLIAEFKDVRITKVTEPDATLLEEKIRCARERIFKES